jgi:TPR repeat protein
MPVRPALLLLLLSAVSAEARADPLRDAQAAYDRGKYETALDIWRPLAEQGNPDAQVGLGNLFLGGYGTARDERAAMEWFRKAADQGDAAGQFGLGSLYYGLKDYGSAATWYRRAAEQGHAIAQVRLGRLYAEGLGVGRDDVQSFKWFAIAAARGADNYARTNAVQGRDGVSARLTPAQVAQARKLAAEWSPKRERP